MIRSLFSLLDSLSMVSARASGVTSHLPSRLVGTVNNVFPASLV